MERFSFSVFSSRVINCSLALYQRSARLESSKNINDAMGTTANDYVIASVAETQLMDVFQHKPGVRDDAKPEYEEQ